VAPAGLAGCLGGALGTAVGGAFGTAVGGRAGAADPAVVVVSVVFVIPDISSSIAVLIAASSWAGSSFWNRSNRPGSQQRTLASRRGSLRVSVVRLR
jgi:hypothetical protein